ncbi:hypothetical protein CU669_20175 [Paramagnetospirillum kuznetsovii]|uniref:Uncharacterized protein n=1 Tax=Paramagnetospirillum kuznetsovii TaxID=2053833 RepID=A0A364NSP1_9PROT|nr:hypothetical protein [Paramagnetospirillum kuznetsovii]RAU20099.1 hypothetical protein CU669_20175 [Paramagnetospirillum kuznetsovii]
MSNHDLGLVISQAVKDAESDGLDALGQRQRAVDAVRTVRPDIPESEAATLVDIRGWTGRPSGKSLAK